MQTGRNIYKIKAIATLIFLLLASCILTAQNKSSRPPEGSDANTPSRLFNWEPYHPGDFDIWLDKNKSLFDRCDVCDLNVSWDNRETQYYGSVFNVATFLVGPADERVTYMIHHVESGLDVRVGVVYYDVKDKNEKMRKNPRIHVAMAFEGAPEEVFGEDTRVEAETVRVKDWQYVKVGEEKRIGPVRYHFTLACTNFKHSIAALLMHLKNKARRNP